MDAWGKNLSDFKTSNFAIIFYVQSNHQRITCIWVLFVLTFCNLKCFRAALCVLIPQRYLALDTSACFVLFVGKYSYAFVVDEPPTVLQDPIQAQLLWETMNLQSCQWQLPVCHLCTFCRRYTWDLEQLNSCSSY